MKKLAIILIMLVATLSAKEPTKEELYLFHKVDIRTYVADYHYFWYDTCKTLRDENTEYSKSIKIIEDTVKVKDICKFIYNYSKVKYTGFAVNCYTHKVKFFKCLEKQNVVLKALDMDL